MDEKDLNNVNQIDMECSIVDDDDTFVLSPNTSTKNKRIDNHVPDYESEDEERDLQSITGIILNFNDTDEDDLKVIKANTNINSPEITVEKNFTSDTDDSNFINNESTIDMETDYYDDTDDPDYFEASHKPRVELQSENHINGSNLKTNRQKSILDFDENPEYFHNELVSEEMIEEKKKITQGEVEADYWKKLQKKHAASNKKGAYNTHFHLAGNAKLEQELFNHDMNTGPIPSPAGGLVGNSDAGNAGEAAGGEGGCCEGLETNNYSELLNDIFNIIGFEVLENSDNSLVAIDSLGQVDDIKAKNLDELIILLNPYIEDCFIYPLQIATNQKFNTCKEWVDWYNSDDNANKFKKCSSDIKYCDVLANHLSECVI